MHEITAKINALNQGGYVYIQTEERDIFLYNSNVKIELPDVQSFDHLSRDQFELTIELIFDRSEYENSNTKGTFTKSLRIKDIKSIRRFKDAEFK